LNKDIKRAYYKVYFIKEYDFNNDFTDKELESEDKENEVIITVILKKALRKIFKYKWLININIISYIINNFNIYRSLLKLCHKVI